MKRILFTLLSVFSFQLAFSQNTIDWDGKYQLQLSDFQSSATEIGRGNFASMQSSAAFDFSFHMSNAEFMFTKNFNSKVRCYIKRDAAMIVAPDSATAKRMVLFARYEFDMAELYARKFRKETYESKGAFSDANFFAPIYEVLQKAYTVRHATAWKLSDGGSSEVRINELHQEVLSELAQLEDFCKTCKPAKKKKQKA